MIYLLLAIVFIFAIIYEIRKRTQATFELLEGISDDINEARMKLGLGMHERIEAQKRRSIREAAERYLVAGKGIEEIKEYFFPLKQPYPYTIGSQEGRKKYDKFMRELIKDFEEAKICPQCKDIYYDYTMESTC